MSYHGRDCPKIVHHGGGYLHDGDHDGPYDVDGVSYCGRCHGWLEPELRESRSPDGDGRRDGCAVEGDSVDGSGIGVRPQQAGVHARQIQSAVSVPPLLTDETSIAGSEPADSHTASAIRCALSKAYANGKAAEVERLRSLHAAPEGALHLERVGRAGFLQQLRDELGSSNAPREEDLIDNVRELRKRAVAASKAESALRALVEQWRARVADMERASDGESWQGEMREIERCQAELAALLAEPGSRP